MKANELIKKLNELPYDCKDREVYMVIYPHGKILPEEIGQPIIDVNIEPDFISLT